MRHPVTMGIVSVFTAVSFLWVLSLSHPEYHQQKNRVAARPAYFAYYNSMHGIAGHASAAKQDDSSSKSADVEVQVRSSSRFAMNQFNQFAKEQTNYVELLQKDALRNHHQHWIADLKWQVDPFYSPHQDRPTLQWSSQLTIRSVTRPLNYFQEVIQDQISNLQRIAEFSREMPPVPKVEPFQHSPIQSRTKSVLHVAVFDQSADFDAVAQNDQPSGFQTFSSAGHLLNNDLSEIDQIVRSIGFRKPVSASGMLPPAKIEPTSPQANQLWLEGKMGDLIGAGQLRQQIESLKTVMGSIGRQKVPTWANKTVTIALSGLKSSGNSGSSFPIASNPLPPLDFNLQGFAGNNPLVDANFAIEELPNTQRSEWMELVLADQKWLNPADQPIVTRSKTGLFANQQGKKWSGLVAFGNQFAGNLIKKWKLEDSQGPQQNQTQNRVVLQQDEATIR